MNREHSPRDWQDARVELLWYVAAASFASVAAAWVLKLWRADLRIPFFYSWDGLSSLAGTKGMLENGWFFVNHSLGAPGSQVLYDYPGSEFFNLLALKAIGMLARDAATTVNIYFLLGFPLIAAAAFWASRELGVSRPASFLVAVLYALLPYHFLRGEQHLFLSMYVLVPFGVVLALWVMRSDDRIQVMRTARQNPVSWPRRLFPLFLCVLIGASGVYYALFTALLVVVAGIVACVRSRKLVAVLPAVVLIGVIALTVLVNVAPTAVYKLRHGPNQSAVKRNPSEAQAYGLRIDGLLMPAKGHRIPALRDAQKAYFAWLGGALDAPAQENATEALGFLGAIGFLVLLATLLLRAELVPPGSRGPRALLGDSSVLLGAIVIVATVSGLGAIFSFAVPLIRAYNRISVFVALLAFMAVAALFDRMWAPDRRATLRTVIVVGVVVLAILDQTTPAFVPGYATIGREYRADAAFVSEVERTLPPKSMVFQLPFVAFPESPFVNKMVDYDHLRPYLHSRSIRWSYGAVKGREADAWNRAVAGRKVPLMISQLRAAGFRGIWVDRFGYVDQGAELEGQIAAVLKSRGLESQSKRYVFFTLQ